jgi:hypothetical protein
MRLTHWGLLCALGLTVAAPLSQANAYAEVGNAGESLATSQAVPGGTTVITGNLSFVDDVDMFRFAWGGGAFSANTYGSAHSDPMLSLFDASGHGIQMDDDTGYFLDQSFFGLPALLDIGNLPAGIYYLAVSSFAVQAFAGADPLFSCLNQCGPTDPTATLTSWAGQGFDQGTYIVNLPATAAEVPEPAALALLAAGLLGLGLARRRA